RKDSIVALYICGFDCTALWAEWKSSKKIVAISGQTRLGPGAIVLVLSNEKGERVKCNCLVEFTVERAQCGFVRRMGLFGPRPTRPSSTSAAVQWLIPAAIAQHPSLPPPQSLHPLHRLSQPPGDPSADHKLRRRFRSGEIPLLANYQANRARSGSGGVRSLRPALVPIRPKAGLDELDSLRRVAEQEQSQLQSHCLDTQRLLRELQSDRWGTVQSGSESQKIHTDTLRNAIHVMEKSRGLFNLPGVLDVPTCELAITSWLLTNTCAARRATAQLRCRLFCEFGSSATWPAGGDRPLGEFLRHYARLIGELQQAGIGGIGSGTDPLARSRLRLAGEDSASSAATEDDYDDEEISNIDEIDDYGDAGADNDEDKQQQQQSTKIDDDAGAECRRCGRIWPGCRRNWSVLRRPKQLARLTSRLRLRYLSRLKRQYAAEVAGLRGSDDWPVPSGASAASATADGSHSQLPCWYEKLVNDFLTLLAECLHSANEIELPFEVTRVRWAPHIRAAVSTLMCSFCDRLRKQLRAVAASPSVASSASVSGVASLTTGSSQQPLQQQPTTQQCSACWLCSATPASLIGIQ
uniref:DUF4806 domain-containing protein n=1 Tax=Macrostomum lignano TaxID=282301 RepID=A0A1I8JQQ4_9PLAT